MQYELAVLISTFERPRHLERCLASLDEQRGVDGRFEVVVTDDGSTDETLDLIREISRKVSFPLTFTTHRHDGFRLAQCRNEGVAASSAPYLLFSDGDCVLPPDHLETHFKERRRKYVVGSDCLRLDEDATARVDIDLIRSGELSSLALRSERSRIRGKAVRAKLAEWLCIPMRPRLTGNNIAMWRDDYERVNGFDERFVGWGFEDRDLQDRLERAGIRIRSILWKSPTVHLWHPPDQTFVRNGDGTSNRRLYYSEERPVFCVDGLVKGHPVIANIDGYLQVRTVADARRRVQLR